MIEPANPRATRRTVARILLLAVSSLVAIKVVDLLLGVFDPVGAGIYQTLKQFNETCVAVTPPHDGLPRMHRLIPGTEVAGSAVYRINHLGYRGPVVEPRKPAGTFRIVLFGDSVTFGWGVPEEVTFARRVERRLNERYGGEPRVEVVNLAVPGYETVHETIAFEERAFAFEPDLVLIVFDVNDVQLVPDEVIQLSVKIREHRDGAGRVDVALNDLLNEGKSRRLLDATLPNLRRMLSLSFVQRVQPEDERQMMEMFRSMDKGIALSVDLLAKCAATAKAESVAFAVLDLHDFEPVAKGLRERAVPYAFIGYHDFMTDMSLRVSAADVHPNAAGHARLAEGAERALDEFGLLPPRR